MAMYQLCRAKAAKHPFYIESIDINIYTIEELCFYLWKNVSLLDESILNEKLCDWLEGEPSRSLVARLGRSGSWLRARVCSISSPRTVLE